MSADHDDEVDRSAGELNNPAIERLRRVELVRKLIKLRGDKRVGAMLLGLLASEQDIEVLKTVVLGLGMMRDKQYIAPLLPMVEHPSMRVTAAAIKSLCKLDPNMEIQTLHPLLASRDGKSRIAAVLALMSGNPRLGTEMLAQLAHSNTESLRHTAVKCLETVDIDQAQGLVVDMFIDESRMAVLKDISRAIKKKGVSREGLDKLNTYRAVLKSSKPADDEERALKDAKLQIMERLMRRSYEKLDLSAGTIGTLEGRMEKKAVTLETQAAEDQKKKEIERRTGNIQKLTAKNQALRRGPPWGKVIAGFVVAMGIAAGAHVSLKSDPVAVRVAPEEIQIPSVLGKAGERISVDAQVLHVYRTQKSVALMVTGPVMIMAVFADGIPAAARAGAKVHLEGTIRNVQGAKSLTVVGEKLVPAT